MTTGTPKPIRDLYRSCVDQVRSRWGSDARDKLGETLHDALVVERMFYLVASQDESIDPSVVVQILRDLHTCHAESMGGNQP